MPVSTINGFIRRCEMHNNICTWKVVATAEPANDDVYEYDDFPCSGCWEDRDWCTCDQEDFLSGGVK